MNNDEYHANIGRIILEWGNGQFRHVGEPLNKPGIKKAHGRIHIEDPTTRDQLPALS